ncbi:protein kinase [Streptomyces sp. NPDC002838]|uniref:protein kinase domain-containing protein n=1 Tax=Streptomyces sp. NPDC002838 TaxID=3154436 RepID=UPI003317C081
MEPLGPEDPERLGPYRLVARLGAGGMGRVYLATSARGRIVAVKAVRPEMMGDKSFRIRFRREVEAARAVSGPYTLPVADAEPDADTPWLATTFIPGPTLAEAVDEHGPLPVESVLALGAGIAEALIAVHAAGLVHRDLKPSNVLLAADGPRVIDFGIVRASDGYNLTRSGVLFGSFEYMCPEQATGHGMGPAGDVFALGSLLTFASTGHAPFSGSAAATLLYQVVHGTPDLTGVPDPLDRILSLCLAREPALRITPDRLSAACAPGGVEQLLAEAWPPPQVAASIGRRTAAVTALGIPQQDLVTVSPGLGPSTPGTVGQDRASYATMAFSTSGAGAPHRIGGAGTTVEPPEPQPTFPQEPGPRPEHPVPPAHRRAPSRAGLTRRTVLAAAAGTAVVGGSAAVLISRKKTAEKPLGPAPQPEWSYRSDPLVQAPAAFNDGTALIKTRSGTLVCLDLKDGTRPKWSYAGISPSPTPALLVHDAVVALGEGAVVIGVDPVSGTERLTLDFGSGYRFDTLLGSHSDRAVTIIGVRLQRRSDEGGIATSTNTVFRTDLQVRRADVVPISAEDVGIPLKPVVLPGYFVYADGLRNVTVRDTGNSGVRWKHPVGYDLRPGVAVLGRTVFAIGRGLIALDLVTGKLRWQVDAEHGEFASLGVAGDAVYVTGTEPYGVYAFDAANGSQRWFCPTPRLNVDNPVTTGARAVYVPAFENVSGFYAIDAARGSLLWNFTDGLDRGVHDWQLACDGAGHLVAQHFDHTYCVRES